MTQAEYEQRLKALQQEVTEAYLKGYAEARDRAQWNLDQTVLKAPLDGVATQVSNIQLGRFLAAVDAVRDADAAEGVSG